MIYSDTKTETTRKPFEWLNDLSRQFLQRGYLSEGEVAEERISTMANHAEKLLGIDGFANKFMDYMGRGWYSISSPIWANFGKKRGLPISCFGSMIEDNIESILYTQSEIGEMSKMGGGTSGYFGNIRGRGSDITDNGKAPGAVHFMNLFETMVDIISQGSTRRGRFAPYLPIDHPDIMEFLNIGTEGFPIQELTHGVTVSDTFMKEMIAGDKQKRKVWAKLLQRRGEIGYPYIFFTDNVNNNTVDVYKDKNMKISASNLCTEIALPSSVDESFVCVLSSMNALYYREWKDTDAVDVLTYFLDAVVTDFLTKLEDILANGRPEDIRAFDLMERAYNFAKRHRALGIGVLGWHSFLQSEMLPFDSRDAAKLNVDLFSSVKERSYAASKELARIFGEPDVLKGYGRRNTTTCAVAPTVSTSFILGQVAQSVQPHMSNCYIKDTAKMKVTVKNPQLMTLLESKGLNNKEVWQSIKEQDGSVQHLTFLSDHERAVFRTFAEISQSAVINQAATRQAFIDQSQSLNLMIPPDMPIKDVNKLIIDGWEMGIKTFYYQHSMNSAQVFARSKMNIQDTYCIACDG